MKLKDVEQRINEYLDNISSKELYDKLIKYGMVDMENLVKVSTYANMIGKSVELVRTWIRNGKFKENEQYIKIDGVIFINLDKGDVK